MSQVEKKNFTKIKINNSFSFLGDPTENKSLKLVEGMINELQSNFKINIKSNLCWWVINGWYGYFQIRISLQKS